MTRVGGCLCGAVRFTAELKGDQLGACHCDMCRKWVGGPLLAAQLTELRLQPTEALRIFSSSEWAERGFCGTCGSSLFYRLTAPGPAHGQVHLAAGSLDDLSGLTLSHEVFTDRRPDAYRFAGELQGMTEAEVFARFAPE